MYNIIVYIKTTKKNLPPFYFPGKICREINRWPWGVRNLTWTPKRYVEEIVAILQ